MKKLLLLGLVGLFLLAIIPSADAVLNVKSYNADTRTITVKDWLGLSPYVKLTLLENTDQCLIDCASKIKMEVAQDMKAVDALEMVKFIKRGSADNVIDTFNYKLQIETYENHTEKEDVYGTCTKENKLNATKESYECVTGTKDVPRTETILKDFSEVTDLKKGTYILHLSATKKPMESFDWVARVGGIEAPEWSWWSSSWSYRYNITITSLAANQSGYNYEIRNISCIGACRDDFADLRFTWVDDAGVETELPYYNEQVHFRDNMTSWVLTPNLRQGLNTFYVYYGNPSATNNSNFTATFKILRADFETGIVNTEMPKQFGIPSVNSSVVFRGDYSAECVNPGVDGTCQLRNTTATYLATGNYTLDYWVLNGPDASCNWYFGEILGTTATQFGVKTAVDATHYVYGDNVATTELRHYNWTHFKVDIMLMGGTATNASYWVNDAFVTSYYDNAAIPGASLTFQNAGAACENLLIDNIKVVKYVSKELLTVVKSGVEFLSASVTLDYPADAYSSSDANLVFNCTTYAAPGNTITNATFYLWYANGSVYTNFTDYTTGNYANITTTTTLTDIADGAHKWNCITGDGVYTAWAATNRTFTIDNTPPTININIPINMTTILTFESVYNITLNVSAIDVGIGLDSCWWYNGTINASFNCADNVTGNFTKGWHEIKVYANDTLGNEAENSTSFLISYVQEEIIYNATTYETKSETYILNLNTSYINSLNISFIYNGTYYLPTTTNNSENATAYKTLTMVYISDVVNRTFYWNYTINGINRYLGPFNQTIYPTNLTYCANGVGGFVTLNFTLWNENTLLPATGNFKIDFDIWQEGSTLHTNKSFDLSGSQNYTFCFGTSTDKYMADADILYGSSPYVAEHYYLRNFQLGNITNHILLYPLPLENSTTFTTTVYDANREKYKDAILKVMRQYIGQGTYLLIEEGLTDNEGNTLVHLINEDATYKFIIEKNNEVIFETLPQSLKCNSLIETCTISIIMSGTSATKYHTFTNYPNVVYSFNFNNDTNMLTYSWNDPTGATHVGRLLILDIMKTGNNITIMNTSVSSSTGIITFNFTGYNGTYLSKIYIGQSPENIVEEMWIVLQKTGGEWGLVGVFFGLLFVLIFFFIMNHSPRAAIIGTVVGIILTALLGLIVWSAELIAGLIIIVLIQLWRMR